MKAKSPVQKAVIAKKKVESSEPESESEEKPQPKKAVVAAKKPVAKKESSSEESEEEVKPQPKKAVVAAKKPVAKKESSSEESEEEVKPAKKAVVAAKKVAKKESSSEESEEEVKPAKKAAPVKVAPKAKAVVEESEEESDDKPQPKKAAVKVAAKPAKVESEIEEEEPVAAPAAEADEEGDFEVCVKGLSFQAYDSDIQDHFSQCGTVLNVKLLTRDDGKSKGIAFVKFGKKSEFTKALGLDGAEHLGRTLKIEESQGKRNNGGDFGGNQRGGFGGAQRGGFGGPGRTQPQSGNANIETPTLFVGGLSYNSTVDSLREFFGQAGQVSSARIVTDKETGKVKPILFSLADSDTLNSTMSTPPRRPTLP